jgi:hypothetical protein
MSGSPGSSDAGAFSVDELVPPGAVRIEVLAPISFQFAVAGEFKEEVNQQVKPTARCP